MDGIGSTTFRNTGIKGSTLHHSLQGNFTNMGELGRDRAAGQEM